MVKFTKNFAIDTYWTTFRPSIGWDKLEINYYTTTLTKAILESGSVFTVDIPTEHYQHRIKHCKNAIVFESTQCDD